MGRHPVGLEGVGKAVPRFADLVRLEELGEAAQRVPRDPSVVELGLGVHLLLEARLIARGLQVVDRELVSLLLADESILGQALHVPRWLHAEFVDPPFTELLCAE